MAQDLIDAVIATLENTSAVVTAFGDTWDQATQTGIAKFFSDVADQVPEPYAILTEIGETYDYMTAIEGGAVNFTSPGQMQLDIWAPGRFQARQLGWMVAKALNDAPVYWPLETAMLFRLTRSMFVYSPTQSGVDTPIVFHRVFYFEYMYSGVM